MKLGAVFAALYVVYSVLTDLLIWGYAIYWFLLECFT